MPSSKSSFGDEIGDIPVPPRPGTPLTRDPLEDGLIFMTLAAQALSQVSFNLFFSFIGFRYLFLGDQAHLENQP